MNKSRRWFAAVPVLVLAIALGGVYGSSVSASPTADSAGKKKKRGCEPAKEVVAIIDDSGSMSGSDPSKFRTAFLDAFAGINDGKRFGGVEFGSTANALWSPGQLPGVIPFMRSSFGLVDADNGGTDYDAGFGVANFTQPKADARIFLSDGLASPPTQHLTPKVKTFVIALGADFAADPSAQALLSQIASQTGGPPPFLISDPSQLQPVAANISAALECGGRPITFSDLFQTAGQTVTHQFRAQGAKANILTTWPTTGVTLTPTVTNTSGGKASIAKVRKTTGAGATFGSVKLTGLRKGTKVKFDVTATVLPQGVIGTTQVVRSKASTKKKKK